MKPLFRALAVSSFGLFTYLTAAAQQDSVSVTYAEEPAESSNFSLKEKYRYWTRASVEEKSMLKAGLSGIGYGGFYGLFLEHAFALERKINVPFSVLAQYRHGMTGWENSHLGLDVGVRWYYSLPRRIRQGKSANNLSANYFSVQLDNTWSGGHTYVPRGQFVSVETWTSRTSHVSLLYGIQRRLGKHGYVDFNVGGAYRPKQWSGDSRRRFFFDSNFSIGFAF
ncbi:MAG: hypothetical protein WA960_09105 [Tunicatimonas sp.]